MQLRSSVLAFIIAFLLAGCIDSGTNQEVIGAGSSSGVPEPQWNGGSPGDPDTAVLSGVVTSDELFPVANALVMVNGQPAAITTEAGSFEIGGFHVGTYTVNVSADGYESVEQKVEIMGPGVVEQRFELRGIPGQSPYVATYIKVGFNACTHTGVYSSGNNFGANCPFGPSNTSLRVDVLGPWRYGVYEMEWQAAEEMIFTSTHTSRGCLTSDPCYGMLVGHSPLRQWARPQDPATSAEFSIDGKKMYPEGAHTHFISGGYSGFFRTEINETFNPACVQINRANNIPDRMGCPFGIGFSTGIRFTMFHSTFYYEEPIDGTTWTARPDA